MDAIDKLIDIQVLSGQIHEALSKASKHLDRQTPPEIVEIFYLLARTNNGINATAKDAAMLLDGNNVILNELRERLKNESLDECADRMSDEFGKDI